MIIRLPILASLAVFTLSLTSCATTEEPPEGSNISGTVDGYPTPDPLSQQMKMQEAMNRTTRSLSPF